MAKGYTNVGGKYYYFDKNGHMQGGYILIGNIPYMFWYADGYGRPAGWLTINGKKAYCLGNGRLAVGKNYVDGAFYKFDKNGYLISRIETQNKNQNTNQSMYNHISWRTSPTGYLIAVDKSTCQVGIFKGSKYNWKNIMTWSCTIGTSSTPTPSGNFAVGDKGVYFNSGNYRCHYYTQFTGNYLFHSVLYYKNGKIADGRLGMRLSHGCIRLDYNNAKWIYYNIPRNTSVIIY